MNLAELRKKAQKGKEKEAERPVASIEELVLPEELSGPEELSPQEVAVSLEVFAPPEVILQALPEVTSPPAPVVEEPGVLPLTAREQVSSTFDPLAVLLAGRESALTDEVVFADAAAAVETGSVEFQEFLCFRVSSEIYAINIMAIKEIIKPREVTEVPRAPAFVAGVLSLRGIIIPVFNMGLRLGLPVADKSPRERIIVLKTGEDFFGIIVDEVIQVVRLAAPTIEKPPAVLDGIDRDFVSGIGRFNGQMLIVLNQEKILDLTLV